MKMLFILFVALSLISKANAQSVGIGTTTPATSGILEMNSTTKGFLLPRMTIAQRNAISSPVQGLMIFCIDCSVGEIEVYSGVYWKNAIGGLEAPPLAIGDSYGGGKVAYILQPGDPGYIAGQVHGIVAAAYDLVQVCHWGCYPLDIPGAEGIDLGTGHQNNMDIVAGCSESGIAARLCLFWGSGGFIDWYLPSKAELNILYLNKTLIGGFGDYNLWSSSEVSGAYAWVQSFSDGSQGPSSKNSNLHLRPVRSF